MKNLTTAIFSQFAGSVLEASVGGRFYKVGAPQGVAWPYVVFFIVTDTPADTFTDNLEDVLIQFSLFSNDPESTREIEDMLTNLKVLFDNSAFTVTGNTMIQMERQPSEGITQQFEETPTGTQKYFQCDVDYEVIMQKN